MTRRRVLQGRCSMKLVVGQNYLVETVTFYWLGRLTSVDGPYTVTLADYSQIASVGRYHEFLRDGRSSQMEVEPAPDGLETTRQWLGITPWLHPLLREVV